MSTPSTEKRTVEVIMDGSQPGQTIRDLSRDARILAKDLQDLAPGTAKFTTEAKKLQQVKTDLADLRAEAGMTGKAMNDLKQELKDILGSMFAIGSIVSFGKAVAENFAKEDESERKLLFALHGREDIQQNLIKQAQDMNNLPTFGHQAIIDAEAFLAAQGRSEAQIKKTMQAAADMSIVTGEDLDSSVKKLDGTMNGVLGRMAKLDPRIKGLTRAQLENGDAITILGEKYKGFADEAGQSAEGGWKRIKNAFSSAMEGIGAGFDQFLTRQLNGWNEIWIVATKGRAAFNLSQEQAEHAAFALKQAQLEAAGYTRGNATAIIVYTEKLNTATDAVNRAEKGTAAYNKALKEQKDAQGMLDMIKQPEIEKDVIKTKTKKDKSSDQAGKDAEAHREQVIKDTQDLNDKILDINQKLLKDKEAQDIMAENRRHDKLLDDIAFSEADLGTKDKAFDAAELEHQANITKIRADAQKQRNEDEFALQVENTDNWYADEKAKLGQQLLDKTIDEKEYTTAIEALDKQLLNTRIANLQDYGKNAKELIQQRVQAEIDAAQKIKEADAKTLKERISATKGYASDVEDVMTTLNSIQTKQEDTKLANDKISTDQQKANLDTLLSHKMISQQNYNANLKSITDAADKEERQVKHDQAIRDQELAVFKATVSMLEGIVAAISEQNYAQAGILAVTGALNIAAIEAQPIPALDAGGTMPVLANGKKYNAAPPSSLGGMIGRPSLALVSENNPEYVINPRMLKNPAVISVMPMLEAIRTNKTFDAGGYFNQASGASQQSTAGYRAPAVSTTQQPSNSSTSDLTNLLLKASIETNKRLHAQVSKGIPARLNVDQLAIDQRRITPGEATSIG